MVASTFKRTYNMIHYCFICQMSKISWHGGVELLENSNFGVFYVSVVKIQKLITASAKLAILPVHLHSSKKQKTNWVDSLNFYTIINFPLKLQHGYGNAAIIFDIPTNTLKVDPGWSWLTTVGVSVVAAHSWLTLNTVLGHTNTGKHGTH